MCIMQTTWTHSTKPVYDQFQVLGIDSFIYLELSVPHAWNWLFHTHETHCPAV